MGSSEPQAGDLLGRYRLVRLIGRGGMGTVFRARDDQLQRDVAVKVINPAYAENDEFRARFRREAVVLSQMDSAHVVSVFDHGEQDGSPYLVTQLIDGGDLLGALRTRGRLDPGLAIDLVSQVLSGLVDAHAIGVVHRDVKPSNVLLREDGRHAYLCDFGIASSPGAELTRTGVMVGSAAYMAPERHGGDGSDVGVTADVYSVGCLLWTVLAGSQPYVGTDTEIALGHLRGPIPQFPGDGAFLEKINAVLRRALAKDPKRRYPSARAMLAELEAVRPLVPAATALPDVTSVRQSLELPPERSGKRRALAVVLVAALVLGALYVGSLLGGVDVVAPMLASDDPQTSGTAKASGSASEEASDDALAAEDSSAGPDEQVLAEPPSGEASLDPGEPTTAAPDRPRSRTPTAPPPLTPAPTKPAPSPKYRCWNKKKVVRLGTCSWPTGRAGANWVFPGASKLSGCTKFTWRAAGFREGWKCSRGSGDKRRHLYLIRWSDDAAAVNYLWGRYNKKRATIRQQWRPGGTYYGTALGGWVSKNTVQGARIYRASGTRPWTAVANASTGKLRQSTLHWVSYRNPSTFRAVRLK